MSRGRASLEQLALFALVFVLGGTVVSFSPARPGARAATSVRRELIGLRTATSSTFANPDGSITQTISAEPFRYRSGGGWRAIDSRLVPFDGRTFAWRNAANRFQTYFGRTAGEELLRLRIGARSYGFSLDGAANTRGRVAGTAVRYGQALRDVDLEYDVQPDGVKETVALRSASAPARYRFWLGVSEGAAIDVEPRVDGGWDVIPRGEAEPLFTLAAPYAVDSAATPREGKASMRLKKIGNRYAVDVEVDAGWLRSRARVFPVRVDPTIIVQRSVDPATEETDATLDARCPTCTLTRPTRFSIGTNSTQALRGALQFDLGLVPGGAAVTNATVQLYYDKLCIGGTCSATAQQFDLHRINRYWSATDSVAGDVQYDPTPLASYTLPGSATARWLTWNVTGTVQSSLARTQPNYGFLVKRTDETLGAGGITPPAGGYAADQSLRPKLEVTYSGDGIDLAPPDTLHANGAELDWTPYTGPGSTLFQKYEVHRSRTAGFTPSSSTLIATISDPTITSFRDTTAAAGGTFTYKVLRNSVASLERTVTLPAEGLASKALQPAAPDSKQSYLVFINNQTSCVTRGRYFLANVGANASSIRRTLLNFDLHDIPTNASVTAATLSLWQTNILRGSGTLNVHRMTSDFTEGTGINTCTGDGATWYERSPGVSWAKPGGDFDATVVASKVKTAGDQPQWDDFTVTSTVQQWVRGDAPNLGFLLKLADESFSPCTTITNCNYWAYFTDDYNVAPTLRPKLTVTYADGSTTVRPTVSVSAPAAGDVVGGTTTVTAAASDDGGVAKVDFYVDGAQAGTSSAPPFQLAWNTTTVGSGTHVLKAVATDDAGNATTSTDVSVSVDNSAAPTTSVTSPAGGATVAGTATVTANAADDRGVSHVEFYVDGNRFTDTANAPYTGTLDTLSTTEPVYDGPHQLTTKAYDAGGHVTTSPPVAISVKNAPAASQFAGTYTSTEFPTVVTYDPALGTQQTSGVSVTVTNTSPVAWGSSVSLRYRWISGDSPASFTDGPSVPLGSTVAPGGSATVNMLVPAPALPSGVQRARYTLRFDLFDAAASAWFAGKGVQPLENPVIVNKALVREALGLERYYHYVGREIGAGMQHLLNIANGNSILRWTPFDEDGRGLSTVLDLTYNALENKCDCPAGNNWSLAISSLSRFGNPIDIHPNKADQIAGNANKFVEFTDGDGTTHRFTDSNNDGSWEAPAGVHLYLRPTGSADPNKYWALTRPDRVTFYYDQAGYPQSVVDGNGNTLTFTESPVAPADDPGGPRFKVTKVTDAGGRDFTITYFTKADAKKPQIRGKAKSITDHLGRELDFDYYLDGNLLRLTQKGGLNPDGSFLRDRSFVLRYTTSNGDGPADVGQDPANPDPKTSNESTRLYSVRDPRGNETRFAYLGSGAGTDRWKLASLTDRAGNATTFSYDTTNRVTTMTEPLSRVSKYAYDTDGKVVKITNPLNQDTLVAWSVDRAVAKVTEPTGVFTSFTYNDNGYLTSTTNQLGNTTQLTYDNSPVDANDVSGKWEPGRTIPHISDLATKTDPKGVATTAIPNDFQWTFGHDANGNITRVTDPLGNSTTNAYNGDGTLASTTDANSNVTSFPTYDASGLATTVVDPIGNATGDAVNHRTTYAYDAAGELLSVQDAIHQSFGAASRSNASFFDYDPFGRMVRQSAPKSTSLEPGNLIWSSASFDANDNVLSRTYPHYGPTAADPGGDKTTLTYDAMDRLSSQTVPHDPASTDPTQQSRTTSFGYDAAGRLTTQTDPKGVLTTTIDKDFATFYSYDLLDRPIVQTRYEVDGTGAITQARTTRACYDLAGDLRSATAPKGEAAFPGCPAATLPYTPLSGNFTASYSYDAAHQLLSTKDPLGRTQSLIYDANGDADSFTDENGTKTTRVYDQKRQVVKEIRPFRFGTPTRDVVTQYVYDKVGNLAKLISPRAYDASSDKQTFTQYVTSYDYDANDQLTRELLPTSTTDTQQLYVHHAYDGVGRELWASLSTDKALPDNVLDSERSQFTYFDPGWLRTSKDPAEPLVTFDYSPKGEQAARTRALSPTDTGTYLTETWSYFVDGALKDRHDAAGAPTTYGYDPNNNLTTTTATGGVERAGESPIVAQNTYDGLNELTKLRQQKVGNPAHFTTYAYDLNGDVLNSEDDATENTDGTVTAGRKSDFTYDQADQVVDQVDHGLQAGCADDQRIQYAYRPTGEPQDEIVSRAGAACTDAAPGWTVKQQTTNTYFLDGALNTVKVWNGPSATATLVQSHTLAYEDAGGIYLNGNQASDRIEIDSPDDTTGDGDPEAPCQVGSACTTSFVYDAKDRLVSYDNARGGRTDYTLLPNGLLKTEAFSNANGANVKTYAYNAPNGVQLTQLQRDATPTGGTTRRARQRFFYNHGDVFCVTHDAINADLTTAAQSARGDCSSPTGGTISPLLDQTYGYDPLDRMAGFHGYEQGAETDSGQWTYDALDRVSTESETHKPSSLNTATVNRTMSLDYQGLSDEIAKETWTGDGATTKTYSYDADGSKVGLIDSNKGNLLYAYNAHGDVSQLLKLTGSAQAAYGYRPYGDEEQGTGAVSEGDSGNAVTHGISGALNNYRYSAKRFDSANDQINMGARFFSPDFGTFMQEDYLRDALGDLDLATDPLSGTRYSLTGGNPINFVEIDGHSAGPSCPPPYRPDLCHRPTYYPPGTEGVVETQDFEHVLDAIFFAKAVKDVGAFLVKKVFGFVLRKSAERAERKALQKLLRDVGYGTVKQARRALAGLSIEEATSVIANAMATKGWGFLSRFLNESEWDKYVIARLHNSRAANLWMGKAVERATVQRLRAIYGRRRFVFNRSHGPDLWDRKLHQWIEITTQRQTPGKYTKYLTDEWGGIIWYEKGGRIGPITVAPYIKPVPYNPFLGY
jgi:RHS repeat-associated protein